MKSCPITSAVFLCAKLHKLYTWAHTHFAIEIIMVETGTIDIYLDNSRYLLTPGTIFLINSNVSHSVILSDDESDYRIRVEIPWLKESHGINHPASCSVFQKGNPYYDEFASLIKTTCEHFANQPATAVLKGDYYYLLGLIRKTGFIEKETVPLPKKVEAIMEFINDKYADDLTIGYIANNIFMTPSYLCRIFKQETNYTVMEYINRVRVKNAEKLLFKTNLSVLEISSTVGFSSQTYFNKIFKKFTSMTPVNYRKYVRERMKLHKKNEEDI